MHEMTNVSVFSSELFQSVCLFLELRLELVESSHISAFLCQGRVVPLKQGCIVDIDATTFEIAVADISILFTSLSPLSFPFTKLLNEPVTLLAQSGDTVLYCLVHRSPEFLNKKIKEVLPEVCKYLIIVVDLILEKSVVPDSVYQGRGDRGGCCGGDLCQSRRQVREGVDA